LNVIFSFDRKKKDFHSLKLIKITLIENIKNPNVTKNKDDEFVNKLTTLKVMSKNEKNTYKCDKLNVSGVHMSLSW